MNHVIWIFRYPNFGFPCNISHMFLGLRSVRKSLIYTFPALLFRYILSGINFSIVQKSLFSLKIFQFLRHKTYFKVSIYTFNGTKS